MRKTNSGEAIPSRLGSGESNPALFMVLRSLEEEDMISLELSFSEETPINESTSEENSGDLAIPRPRPYACDHPGCGYAASEKRNLTVHKRRHTGEKPFVCDEPGCAYAASRRDTLITHKRTHTGERPYPCDHPGCEYAATTSGSLVSHKRTHTGEKPFACDEPGCDYAASQSGALTRHKRNHAEERPYACDEPSGDSAVSRGSAYLCFAPDCGFRTNSRENLIAHKRNRH